MKKHPPIRLDVPELPRHPSERYRIYAVRGAETDPVELASTDCPEGIGVALVTLHEDAKAAGRRLCDEGLIGVLDSETSDWICLPWPRGGLWPKGGASR